MKKRYMILLSIIVLSLLFVSCELFEDDEKTVNSGSGLQLSKEVASYNNTSYASVQEAVTAALKDNKAQGDKTIKLLCDVRGGGFTVALSPVEPLEESSTIKGKAEPESSYEITLDFQGHTYELASETGIKMMNANVGYLHVPYSSYPCIRVENVKNINIKNAKLKRGDGVNYPLFWCSDSIIKIDRESQLNAGIGKFAMEITNSDCEIETADITGIVSIDTDTNTDKDTEHTISFNKDTDFKNKVTLFGDKLCIKSEGECLKVEALDDEIFKSLDSTTITFEVALKEENKEENIVDVDEFRKKYYDQDDVNDSIQKLIKCLGSYELYFYYNDESYQIKSQNDLIPYIEKYVFTKINKDPSILVDKLNSTLCMLPLHAIGINGTDAEGTDIPICVRFVKFEKGLEK